MKTAAVILLSGVLCLVADATPVEVVEITEEEIKPKDISELLDVMAKLFHNQQQSVVLVERVDEDYWYRDEFEPLTGKTETIPFPQISNCSELQVDINLGYGYFKDDNCNYIWKGFVKKQDGVVYADGWGEFYMYKGVNGEEPGKYVGQFKNNHFHGQGAWYDSKKNIICYGEWLDDCPVLTKNSCDPAAIRGCSKQTLDGTGRTIIRVPIA